MDHFKREAVELVVNAGFTHKDLLREIRAALKETSDKLEMREVLYCGSYGGFEYSKEFARFLHDGHDHDPEEPPDRCVIEELGEFGRDMQTKYPKIHDMVSRYCAMDLDSAFHKVAMIVTSVRELAAIRELIETRLSTASDDEFFEGPSGDAAVVHAWQLALDMDLSRHSKAALLDACDADIAKHEACIRESQEKLASTFSTECVLAMIHSCVTRRSAAAASSEKLDSFADAIARYGLDDSDLWRCQAYFDVNAMRFLAGRNHALPLFDVDEQQLHKNVDIEVGLLFASTRYCKLKVARVPQVLGWKVVQYDGKESIRVL